MDTLNDYFAIIEIYRWDAYDLREQFEGIKDSLNRKHNSFSTCSNTALFADWNIDIKQQNHDSRSNYNLILNASHGLLPAYIFPPSGINVTSFSLLKNKNNATALVLQSFEHFPLILRVKLNNVPRKSWRTVTKTD